MAGKLDKRELLAFAGRQHQVLARPQVRGLGYTDHEVDGLIKRGWLRPVHRGVYAVGRTALTREGIWMAATLALGDRAVLSHRSAAELWGLIPGCSSPVHVTVPRTGARSRRRGLVIHRSPLAGEITRERNIPVTSHRGP